MVFCWHISLLAADQYSSMQPCTQGFLLKLGQTYNITLLLMAKPPSLQIDLPLVLPFPLLLSHCMHILAGRLQCIARCSFDTRFYAVYVRALKYVQAYFQGCFSCIPKCYRHIYIYIYVYTLQYSSCIINVSVISTPQDLPEQALHTAEELMCQYASFTVNYVKFSLHCRYYSLQLLYICTAETRTR